ncbi:hypothetical protein J6590_005242 [Homalodisca vitripennis]|nr:hypothetical protein J6590_005242 [Homalodisca vitripennis]
MISKFEIADCAKAAAPIFIPQVDAHVAVEYCLDFRCRSRLLTGRNQPLLYSSFKLTRIVLFGFLLSFEIADWAKSAAPIFILQVDAHVAVEYCLDFAVVRDADWAKSAAPIFILQVDAHVAVEYCLDFRCRSRLLTGRNQPLLYSSFKLTRMLL